MKYDDHTQFQKLVREKAESKNSVDWQELFKAEDDLTARLTETTLISNHTLLHLAVYSRDVKLVKELVAWHKKLNLPVNVVNRRNETALHVAASSGNSAIVQVLIDCHKELGVSLDAVDEGGATALHLALRSARKNDKIIKSLVSAGAATGIEDNHGWTAKALAEHLGIDLEGFKSKSQDSLKNSIGSTFLSPPSTTPAPPAPPSPPTASGAVTVQPQQQVVTCH